jgi:hypothetical protein
MKKITMSVKNNEGDDHKKRMPIELKSGFVLPSESATIVKDPD